MATLDLEAIREAIGQTLDPIPELLVVARYDPLTTPTNNLPFASIRRGGFVRVEPEPFGQYTYLINWRINVVLTTNHANAEIEAQQLADVIALRMFTVVNADPTLDPSGPGVVDQAFLAAGDPPQPTPEGVWSCPFTLTTLVTTT